MISGSPFFEKVYAVTRKIPCGRITTYGAIASFIAVAGSARMVGWALNNSHSQKEYVPAHRVVNRTGLLTGKHHFGQPGLMQELLENEGAVIVNNRVINFREKFWDPSDELKQDF